jgi:hypothetical protein
LISVAPLVTATRTVSSAADIGGVGVSGKTVHCWKEEETDDGLARLPVRPASKLKVVALLTTARWIRELTVSTGEDYLEVCTSGVLSQQ